MFKVIAEEHTLGHCGCEGMGSEIFGDIAEFETKGEAENFMSDMENNICSSCGGYAGTLADPSYCEIIEISTEA